MVAGFVLMAVREKSVLQSPTRKSAALPSQHPPGTAEPFSRNDTGLQAHNKQPVGFHKHKSIYHRHRWQQRLTTLQYTCFART